MRLQHGVLELAAVAQAQLSESLRSQRRQQGLRVLLRALQRRRARQGHVQAALGGPRTPHGQDEAARLEHDGHLRRASPAQEQR